MLIFLVKRLLFICVENANRSQMAEAFARLHGGAGVEAYSAGSRPNEYMSKNGVIVPTRGVIHDIGRAMTHKSIIVELYKRGYQTPEIAGDVTELIGNTPIVRLNRIAEGLNAEIVLTLGKEGMP